VTILTADQIRSLAPDPQVFAAGQKLARPGNWSELGRGASLLWGQCQGSALYHVQVDLSAMAFKCSCPSRKQPCKHVVGLLSLSLEPADLPETEPPPRVLEWIARRETAQAKKESSIPSTPKTDAGADVARASMLARRSAERAERVAEGIEGLDLWLNDLIRNGLSSVETKPSSFWERQAARLVDAQAPGLAGRVRRLAAIPGSSPHWPQQLLDDLGRLALLTQAYRRLDDKSSPDREHDLRQLVGWTMSKEEISQQGERVRDEWMCVGQYIEEENRLQAQRTWLTGLRTGRAALILQFAPGRPAFPWIATPGTCQEMELQFWPGACPQRARIETRHGEPRPFKDRLPHHETVEDFLGTVAAILAANPWTDRFLCLLRDVIPVPTASGPWQVRDSTGVGVFLQGSVHWGLLAASGGEPLDVWGEWNGRDVRVLGNWASDV
jgi:SWIM zinc finger